MILAFLAGLGELHRYEGDARQCCMPQIMEVWECGGCGEIRGTESEAEECCAVAGARWHPSNGTEGEAFICRNCAYCARDAHEDCEILARSFREPVEQWRQLPDGQLICTAFVAIGEPPRCDPAELEAAGQGRLL